MEDFFALQQWECEPGQPPFCMTSYEASTFKTQPLLADGMDAVEAEGLAAC